MINTKLDTKFSNFLQESKQKLHDLEKEIDCLGTENFYLEQQISNTFHTNSDLEIELKKYEIQLKRFKEMNSINLSELKVIKVREQKAKKDLDNLTAAHTNQRDLAKSEKKVLMEKEKVSRYYRKANEDMFRDKKMELEHRSEELQNEIMLKSETSQALMTELSNSECIESDILSSIKAEMIGLTSITGSSFNPRRTK